MDLKDHIFPMVGGVVTLASQGHLPFPRQGVGYEKDAVLASELPLMRRGNMGAFDEQEDMDETGGVDGTILAPPRPSLEPGKDAPKFGYCYYNNCSCRLPRGFVPLCLVPAALCWFCMCDVGL